MKFRHKLSVSTTKVIDQMFDITERELVVIKILQSSARSYVNRVWCRAGKKLGF